MWEINYLVICSSLLYNNGNVKDAVVRELRSPRACLTIKPSTITLDNQTARCGTNSTPSFSNATNPTTTIPLITKSETG